MKRGWITLGIGVGLWVLGGLLAALWQGPGPYAMVGLDLIGIVVLFVGIVMLLRARRRVLPVTDARLN